MQSLRYWVHSSLTTDGRAWKRIDFSVMEALAEKGDISNPHGRTESVYLTKDGLARAKELAERMFSE